MTSLILLVGERSTLSSLRTETVAVRKRGTSGPNEMSGSDRATAGNKNVAATAARVCQFIVDLRSGLARGTDKVGLNRLARERWRRRTSARCLGFTKVLAAALALRSGD